MSAYLGSTPTNILNVLFRNKGATALYRGSTLLQSFGASSPPLQPKLQADFITGTYKANGEAKTFADLFTFNRAGKAWLVKDVGLVEYAIDEPRFDDGLLIERESTNLQMANALGGGDAMSVSEFIDDATFGALVPRVTNVRPHPSNPIATRQSYHFLLGTPYEPTLSAYMRTDAGTEDLYLGTTSGKYSRTSSMGYNPVTGVIEHNPNNKAVAHRYGDWSFLGVECLIENDYFLHVPAAIVAEDYDSLYIALRQSEYGELSSYILTDASPVTRPSDYLLANTTGTTVTGDWDSTLTLSIVNGQLTHSGYGRIRSLEIK